MKRLGLRAMWCAALVVLVCTLGRALAGEAPVPAAKASPYAAWSHGPDTKADFFPIAVWLQAPRNAPKYKAIGVNLYVGLWKGPTGEQLSELRRHGMPVVCAQNDYARKHLDEKMIVAWMHGDEPDNAQSLGPGKGYGPPISPERIVEGYRRIKANDPTRPVLLNLGQGVAWDGWYGRGVRTNHPEDYPQYVRGCDIASFDIYPAVHSKPAVAGKLWYVARGVDRLRQWAGDRRVVWNCIECTRISNVNVKPTPRQVKAEVWMSIIHGSQGIIYFCHQFKPSFVEAGLLADEEMAGAVAAVNREIHSLATVINGPTPADQATVTTTPEGQVDCMLKRVEGVTYLFAVNMRNRPEKATIRIKGLKDAPAEVLFEDRSVEIRGGRLVDGFEPYAVHRYRIAD